MSWSLFNERATLAELASHCRPARHVSPCSSFPDPNPFQLNVLTTFQALSSFLVHIPSPLPRPQVAQSAFLSISSLIPSAI